MKELMTNLSIVWIVDFILSFIFCVVIFLIMRGKKK